MRDYEVYTSAAVSIIVLYGIASIARQYARLKHIRGPSVAGFTNWWLVRALRSGRVHLEFYEAYQRYGMLGPIPLPRAPERLTSQDLLYVSGRGI